MLRPAAKLCYRTVVDGGWRDGWRGLLKISLDVGSDALVWVLVLLRPGPAPAPPPGGGGAHFGRRRGGPVRIVAVSGRGRPTERAVRWLSALQQHGADVALISEEPAPCPDLPQQTVARIGPLVIARALDVERQVRVVDVVVPFGRRARLVQRVLPPTLRPAVAGVDCDAEPDRAFELARAAVPQ